MRYVTPVTRFLGPTREPVNKICWRTLEHVMGSLILKKDFDILFESHKKKMLIKEKNLKADTPQEAIDA